MKLSLLHVSAIDNSHLEWVSLQQ